MNKDINKLFEKLWQKYILLTPTALKIHELLGSLQEDDIKNDHIALRTFNIEKVNLEKLAMHFKVLGYKEAEEYHFKEKQLFAKHFEHYDLTKPKVFISELLVEEFPLKIQHIINDLVNQVDEKDVSSDEFLYSGRKWKLDYRTYKILLEISEYAAWTSAWGYCANHFTVNINELKNFSTIKEVNQKLKDAGFFLNNTGGEVKGSPSVFLEQSSTLADNSLVKFSDNEMLIPSCFYEFALRYKMPNGKLYTGFVEQSANMIFNSTNVR